MSSYNDDLYEEMVEEIVVRQPNHFFDRR